jgi:hypothetical protein
MDTKAIQRWSDRSLASFSRTVVIGRRGNGLRSASDIAQRLGTGSLVPTQKRRRRDQKRRPPDSRQHPRRRRQKPSVGQPKCRPSKLAAQDRQLVAQCDDLKFLELGRPKQQEDKLQNALKRDVKNRQDRGACK